MAATDLTTVAAVRAFLQKQTVDVNQDAVVASMITAASVEIMRVTSREFAPATDGASRDFEYEGGGFLSFGSYDLRTLTSVLIDVDESPATTLVSTEYRLFPQPARDGVFTALRLAPYILSSRTRWQQRLVRVTGDWGFESVPEPVENACIVTVATWLRRDVQAFSSTFNIDEGRVERPEALPEQAVRMLAPYRREAYP
jgi:hypothetical protein